MNVSQFDPRYVELSTPLTPFTHIRVAKITAFILNTVNYICITLQKINDKPLFFASQD